LLAGVNIVGMNVKRYLTHEVISLCFDDGKMAFISGPRQVGKTTLAKSLLSQRGLGGYYNWDETKFRRIWTKDPSQILIAVSDKNKKKPLYVLDEIHKARLWKRNLKGLYDTIVVPSDFIITGSARLNVYRKGSDSLLGRYHHFLLHPFSVNELLGEKKWINPDELHESLFSHAKRKRAESLEHLILLNKFGGFPEPLFSQSIRKLNLWKRERLERLIREDLRDISRLPELSQVEMLASLLPERVASPLSTQSLAEDLEVAFNTVKRWLTYLSEVFYHFELKPYNKSLPRSIKKEGKLYLWDWSEVENPGARFENLIASHLFKYCHYLSDCGYGDYKLRYVRNKEKKEIDFLIIKDNKPWLPIEVKLSDDKPSPNWKAFMKHLKCKQGVQVVMRPDIFKVHSNDGFEILVVSADYFLRYFI